MSDRLTITKRMEIDAGHRLSNHEGKCRHLHGHRYAFEITCSADQLDEAGRVIDFSVIKDRIGGWLEQELDHAMILESSDPLLGTLRDLGQSLYILDEPPTAENLARHVFSQARDRLSDLPIEVKAVRCWETPKSRADVVANAE